MRHNPGKTSEHVAYAQPPLRPPSLEDCLFYHSIELPGVGLREGQWDLRGGVDAYLGHVDVRGLRVLEIGTANGFVCFELERRGARVVAVDLPEDATYDTRPGAGREDVETMRLGLRGIRNAYWLAHSLLGSSAQVVYSHVNDLPADLGRFDAVLLANVLQHCRDPVRALFSASRFADTVIVTEAEWMELGDLAGMALFEAPAPFSWFQVTFRLVTSLLAEVGYARAEVTHHEQRLVEDVAYGGAQGEPRRWEGGLLVPHFTVVARR